MSWIIHVGIGLVIGIMFSVAYPELAVTINNSIDPTLESIGEFGIDKLKDTVTNFISSNGIENQ